MSPTPTLILRLLPLVSAVLASTALAQPLLAQPGAHGLLTVEYTYRSEGRIANRYDSREWRVTRRVSISTELVAAKPTSLSSVAAPEAGQQARTDRAVAQGEVIAQQMGGSMAQMQAAFEKCGDDQACLQRLTAQMTRSATSKSRSETQRVARETEAATRPGAVRYQLWRGHAQQGSYSLSEDVKIRHADPICLEGPGTHCHRSEVRRGEGTLPSGPRGSAAATHIEFDAEKQTLLIRLPVPMGPLAYTETVVTDEPQHTKGQRSVELRSNKALDFRAPRELAPRTVALKGDGKSPSGTFTIDTKGEREERGRLEVRWSFEAR